MEKNIGYAVITTEEYNNLIINNMSKDEKIKKLKTLQEKYEKAFLKRIADRESYYIENMEKCNLTDYRYQRLYECFLEIGIENTQYIDEKIKELKDNFDSGNYKGDEE